MTSLPDVTWVGEFRRTTQPLPGQAAGRGLYHEYDDWRAAEPGPVERSLARLKQPTEAVPGTPAKHQRRHCCRRRAPFDSGMRSSRSAECSGSYQSRPFSRGCPKELYQVILTLEVARDQGDEFPGRKPISLHLAYQIKVFIPRGRSLRDADRHHPGEFLRPRWHAGRSQARRH